MADHAGRKRRYDAIDLTGDDAPSASQSYRPSPGEHITQSQRDSWLEQGNEGDADDIVVSSQDGDDAVTASYQLYGMRCVPSHCI